jgi:hypothetical protein
MMNRALNISDESVISDASMDVDMDMDMDTGSSPPISPSASEHSTTSAYSLFSPSSPSRSPSPLQTQIMSEPAAILPSPTSNTITMTMTLPYQDPETPMLDPWLVRMVLDMYDVRGFDWTMIAEPIERCWGVRTSSAEVLGILSRNGRVLGRRWWD